MAGSPQTDPRADDEFRPWDAALPSDAAVVAAVVAAVKALLHGPGEWTGDGLQIAQLGQQIVRAVHAADEASGVCRVTAHELADNLELARQEERQRVIRAMLAAHPVERRQSGNKTHGGPAEYSAWCTKCRGFLRSGGCHVRNALSAADSPVGGVS